MTGPVTLIDPDGNPIATGDGSIALCRCGHSANKPFCDASHKGAGFASCVRAGA